MQVEIPREFEPFIHAQVQNGHCGTESEVVAEALRLLREIESRREELRRDIAAGMQSGEGVPADVVFRHLREKVRNLSSRPSGAAE